jgi:6-phosphofructokinase 1
MSVRRVNVDGEAYECARHYMIRLEPSDFEAPQLKELAASIAMSPEQFRERFGYVAGVK